MRPVTQLNKTHRLHHHNQLNSLHRHEQLPFRCKVAESATDLTDYLFNIEQQILSLVYSLQSTRNLILEENKNIKEVFKSLIQSFSFSWEELIFCQIFFTKISKCVLFSQATTIIAEMTLTELRF